MNLKQKTFTLFCFFSFIHSGFAQVLRLEVTDYGWIENIPLIKPVLDSYLEQEEAELNREPYVKDPKRFMRGTANSTALASRGVGTDYATPMEKFMMGLAVGAAIDPEKDVALEDEISGVGGAAGFTFGAKLNDKINLYANVGGLSHSRTFSGIEDTDLDAEITTFNIGSHLSYDLVSEEWGGVRVQFGYEYNVSELTFENELNEDLELDTGVAVIQGRLKGRPRYEIQSNIHSFPFEVSSNIRFLKYFSLFAGTGLDINFGKAKGSGDIKADITSPLTCASGICTNLDLPEVQVTGNLDAEDDVDRTVLRGFGGLQINLPHASIYGMVNKVIRNKIIGASVGLKAVF